MCVFRFKKNVFGVGNVTDSCYLCVGVALCEGAHPLPTHFSRKDIKEMVSYL